MTKETGSGTPKEETQNWKASIDEENIPTKKENREFLFRVGDHVPVPRGDGSVIDDYGWEVKDFKVEGNKTWVVVVNEAKKLTKEIEQRYLKNVQEERKNIVDLSNSFSRKGERLRQLGTGDEKERQEILEYLAKAERNINNPEYRFREEDKKELLAIIDMARNQRKIEQNISAKERELSKYDKQVVDKIKEEISTGQNLSKDEAVSILVKIDKFLEASSKAEISNMSRMKMRPILEAKMRINSQEVTFQVKRGGSDEGRGYSIIPVMEKENKEFILDLLEELIKKQK
ncbi:MAG: hypothetical protein PHN19_05365 [Patescibacteria group bacterium]|nr:hypothetical protein [Patescibacteria group bacterium]